MQELFCHDLHHFFFVYLGVECGFEALQIGCPGEDHHKYLKPSLGIRDSPLKVIQFCLDKRG
jgi:hypothetical protein